MNETPVASQPASTESIKKSNKQKLLWGLVCLIAPTALIIVSLLLYAIVNFFFSGMTPEPTCPTGFDGGACYPKDEMFGQPSPIQTITNVVMFLVSAVSAITWLPGIIIGIILLASRKHLPA